MSITTIFLLIIESVLAAAIAFSVGMVLFYAIKWALITWRAFRIIKKLLDKRKADKDDQDFNF